MVGIDLEGSFCPVVTPFFDGAVDETGLAAIVEQVVEAGIDRVVARETTGEFASLSNEEYECVLRVVTDAADDRVPVIAGTAATSVAGVEERIDHAMALGADAALVP